MHFTHVQHLPTLIQHGLISDAGAREMGLTAAEVGEARIEEQRRHRFVPCDPGGTVGNYVPFYYAPRSPMMFSISHGNVPTWHGGCKELIYLVTTLERLSEEGCVLIFTDRNAVLKIARFSADVDEMGGFTDWELMRAVWWRNTDEEPDRRERRQAECLVLDRVPFAVFQEIVVHDEAVAKQAQGALTGLSVPVVVRADWYI